MFYKRYNKIRAKRIHKENDQISAKDLYNQLWEGRNLEISTLWQRSALLIALLTLSFAGYGGLWISFLDNNHKLVDSLGYNLGFLVISLCGILFSVLWIMMAKGSKYWVEKYEASINSIVRPFSKHIFLDDSIVFDDQGRKDKADVQRKTQKGLQDAPMYPEYFPRHGSLVGITRDNGKIDDSLFSTKGAPFSPSKVNIVIGIASLIMWICAAVIHLLCLVLRGFGISLRKEHIVSIGSSFYISSYPGFVLFIFFVMLVGFFIWIIRRVIVKGRSNEHIEEKKKAIFKRIETFKKTKESYDCDYYKRIIRSSLSNDEACFSELKQKLDSIEDYGVIENINTILDEELEDLRNNSCK